MGRKQMFFFQIIKFIENDTFGYLKKSGTCTGIDGTHRFSVIPASSSSLNSVVWRISMFLSVNNFPLHSFASIMKTTSVDRGTSFPDISKYSPSGTVFPFESLHLMCGRKENFFLVLFCFFNGKRFFNKILVTHWTQKSGIGSGEYSA